ncbi:MarR family winged helix-turn-helix transcriptional regulator [Ornithinimicrobium pratense]|uniref:MarR family transcriptional regulator n=1 Tax=Ornithinimicrobium pratense TaxID=2593973 RepID=A0A5J6V9H9_9MICO|nr:MarR family transcriptional regulator [Ornithinimicrobium pratense]QFG69856.1 MarR family transcriptional regulator [Ornithinimicrobium pratense]
MDRREEGTPAPAPAPGHASRWVQDWQRSQTLDALRRLLNTSGRVTPALARRTGLSHTELSVLEHVMEEPLGPSELAQRIGVTSAAASGIVDRLVARGHAERQPHPTDRRRTAVVCTSSGREELIQHLMPMFVELARLDADFTDGELAVIHRFLTAADRAVGRLL